MRNIGIVHLLYEVPRHRPVCVQRLRQSYGNVSQTAVYIRTAGVPKRGQNQSSPLEVVYCHAHYRNCTTTI